MGFKVSRGWDDFVFYFVELMRGVRGREGESTYIRTYTYTYIYIYIAFVKRF